MNTIRTSSKFLCMTIISFMVIGCASMQPLSNYARTGDTVAISLGGTDSNALVPVLKKENIAIIITDAANNVYPIKIRNVFRIYSDPTSIYSYSRGSVPPHMGQWMAIIDLVDPNSGQPPALAIGPATLSVSSPQIQNYVDYPGGGFPSGSGNLGAIPIQILAGTGSANPMNYESYVNVTPLDDLEPLPQVEISVAGTPSTLIGGGTFTFRYVTVDFNQNGRPQVTTTTPDPNVQLASNYVGQADGTTQLTVLITNPHGFNIDNRQTGLDVGRSLLRSLRFNIIWNNYTAITDSNWQQSLQLVSGQYFDLNGNVMSGISPVVTKVR